MDSDSSATKGGWSKVYRGQVYQNPPLAVMDPKSRELSWDECREIAQQMTGRPVCEEHDHTRAVGRVLRFDQDHTNGSLWAEFQLHADTPTHAKVARHEMLGLSLGHEIQLTVPRRKVRGLELSVCKQGERPNTFIVNASQAPVFAPAKPHVVNMSAPAPSLFNSLNGYDLVLKNTAPQSSSSSSTLSQMPVEIVGMDGQTYELRPRPVMASGSAPQQAPSVPVQSMAQQMPYPFNNMPTYSQQQPQPQQQQQQQLASPPPPQGQQQQPREGEGERPKASKRRAASSEDGDAMETDSSSFKERKEGKETDPEDRAPAAKKAKENSSSSHSSGGGSADGAIETGEELKAAVAGINGSNIPTALKAQLIGSMTEAFEMRQQMNNQLRGQVNAHIALIENSMRANGAGDEQIAAWKADLQPALDNPVRHKNIVNMLAGMATALPGGNNGGSSASVNSRPSHTPLMTSGMNASDLALQRQLDRVNQITGMNPQSMTVLSSVSTAPSFPTRSTAQLPVAYEDGRQSVFQARFANPAALARDPTVSVARTMEQGWIVGGVPQRQAFLNPPPQQVQQQQQ